jgi:hypothetical protein
MNPPSTSAAKPRRYLKNLIRQGNPATRRMASLRIKGAEPQLDSTFALAALTNLAHELIAPQFIMEMATIFGLDVPPPVYLALQEALIEGKIPAPNYSIVATGIYPADYDNRDRTIRIHASAVDYIVRNPESTWELVAILLHEFGHHLDNVIRQDLAPDYTEDTVDLHPDAAGEEGTRFAMHMATVGADAEGAVTVALYRNEQGTEHVIEVDSAQAMRAVMHRQSDITQYSDGEIIADREGFEADGTEQGLFSHQRIEAGMQAVGFAKEDLQAIYFGNWLLDYSQLLDPKLVRHPNQKKNFPSVLSRKALTDIVDVLAARKFPDLRTRDRVNYTVTEQKLGVYRPSRHIDNPKVENPNPADPRTRDREFEPWVQADNPLLEVEYETSMKSYIHRSAAVMYRELAEAMKLGYSPQGLQKLGGALHILEDFFAHSNFVELKLIGLGHEKVKPWTGTANCKHGYPLVTGMFGGSDVIASLAGPVAKVLAPEKVWKFTPSRPGDRSDSERMLLILLAEHQEDSLLKAFNTFLEVRDEASKSSAFKLVELYIWVVSTPRRLAGNAWSAVFQGVIEMIGHSIDDIQTHSGADPHKTGSTDPSHSQLSKDHAEHPLHIIAAGCASIAIKDVARAMINHWHNGSDVKPTDIAVSYFAHPQDTNTLDDMFIEWAERNPAQILRASDLNELETIQELVNETAAKKFKDFAKGSSDTWEYFQGISKALGIDGSSGSKGSKEKPLENLKPFYVKG